jgi:hypothetical protein
MLIGAKISLDFSRTATALHLIPGEVISNERPSRQMKTLAVRPK